MKYLGVILILIATFALFDVRTCHGREWGPTEGKLKNVSNSIQLCLWDNLEGKLCGKWVSSGSWCRGDAMTYRFGVFKVPNRSHWVCYEWGCEAQDLASWALLQAASIKNGFNHYGEMTMEHFKELMWDWSIELCE